MKIPCRNKISGNRGFKARRSFGKVNFSQSPRPTRLAVHLFSAWGTQRPCSGGAHRGRCAWQCPRETGKDQGHGVGGAASLRSHLLTRKSPLHACPTPQSLSPRTGATPGVCPQRAASGGLLVTASATSVWRSSLESGCKYCWWWKNCSGPENFPFRQTFWMESAERSRVYSLLSEFSSLAAATELRHKQRAGSNTRSCRTRRKVLRKAARTAPPCS